MKSSQIIYFLYQEKEISKNVYDNRMNSSNKEFENG